MPPALPTMPPAGACYPGGPQPPINNMKGEDHEYMTLYDNKVPNVQPPPPGFIAGPPPKTLDDFPELPAVPTNTLPDPGFSSVGGNSTGGDDVDFDDLTRRFEDLKKKK